jgi:hexosaminidase
MKKIFFFLLLFTTLGYSQTTLPLIPHPKEMQLGSGNFTINKATFFLSKDKNNNEIALFNSFLLNKYGYELNVETKSKSNDNSISISVENPADTTSEKYELTITPTQIIIKSIGNKGVFYAFQTLIQLLPANKFKEAEVPCLTIKDEPKFKWRGMHLDVSRHFFAVDFIKKYIDYLAMYKMNTFHWHLTDDQGWRIEILQYPRLTQLGSIRFKSMIGHYSEQRFDDKTYRGFYTQEEIKDVVAYAQQRHVTIIPEIEMPGHAMAALAAYPQYSCTGGPFDVGTKWGNYDDVFCPKEETFQFLQEILDEVMVLFPSEYIHIGGDECSKVRWKSCSNCQALMQREGLTDEMQLQSYFITRMGQFLNAYGKKLIGWDEILEGGLGPNATVMSWRGTEGGIVAAKENHDVIMSPGSHCYFDHYQGDPKHEPLAFGGYATVEKVYSFNPIPAELTAEEGKHILGAQGNVWTEYINTPQEVEYMAMPRMAALSEVVWGTSKPSDYANFQTRLIKHFDVLDRMSVNYSKSIFQITSNVAPAKTGKGVEFTLKSAYGNKGVYYTTNGDAPSLQSKEYDGPFIITESSTLRAAYFEGTKQKGVVIEQPVLITQSTGKAITLVTAPHQSYAIGGKFTLVDGMRGSMQKFSRDWLGFLGNDLNATIDLGVVTTVSKVTVDVLQSTGSWIHYPKSIEVFLSNDGVKFKSVKLVSDKEISNQKGSVVMPFPKENAKFIKVIAKKIDKIPVGSPGEGSPAWLFADEIMVE